MKKPILAFLIGLGILIQGVWALEPRDLCGIWVLDSPDPRWTAWLELNEDGRLWLRSTVVTEKHLSNGTTQALQNEVVLKGTWDLAGIQLDLPLNEEQSQFARMHLPERPIRFDGGLIVGRLKFQRHKKNI